MIGGKIDETTDSDVDIMEEPNNNEQQPTDEKEEQAIVKDVETISPTKIEEQNESNGKSILRRIDTSERTFENVSNIASMRRSMEIDRIHKERLSRALSDAGRQSTGIVAVEAWVVNSKGTHLVRPEEAFWRDQHYVPPSGLNARSVMRELARLEDPKREDYIDVTPVQPGQGFVGHLWSMSHDHAYNSTGISAFGSYHGNTPSGGPRRGSFGSASRSFRMKFFGQKARDHETPCHQDDMTWLDLDYLAIDPDHIPSRRVHSLLVAGIGKVSGVTFNIRGYKGMVIYFAKSDCPLDDLLVGVNQTFLTGAADCIGSILAMSEPRRTALICKMQMNDMNGGLHPLDEESQPTGTNPQLPPLHPEMVKPSHGEICLQRISRIIKFKAGMVYEKTVGEKRAHPPPSMSYSESLWVVLGSSVSLLLTLYLSQGILFWNKPNSYAFPVGPMGALATLQFGLTAAPASQPRNIMYGTLIAGAIGLGFKEISVLPHWVRISFGGSVAVTAMAKLGVIHPPAGAIAVIYASGEYHWGHLALSMLANLIAIGVSILVNNLNTKRQYPQYWSWNPFVTH